jgi:hypothetical protein
MTKKILLFDFGNKRPKTNTLVFVQQLLAAACACKGFAPAC